MSSLNAIIDTLRLLKPELAGRFGVSVLGIFSSVTRQDFRPVTSDIDIIVEFSRPVGVEFIDLANYLEKVLDQKVDLVSKRCVKESYLRTFEKDIIYV